MRSRHPPHIRLDGLTAQLILLGGQRSADIVEALARYGLANRGKTGISARRCQS